MQRPVTQLIPFPRQSPPPSTAPPHTIIFPPLTPADKLTQAERWLDNTSHAIDRRYMRPAENITVALTTLVCVAEKLDEAGCELHGDRRALGAAGAYATDMREHGAEAARYADKGWTQEAEREIRHAISDGRRAVAQLRSVVVVEGA